MIKSNVDNVSGASVTDAATSSHAIEREKDVGRNAHSGADSDSSEDFNEEDALQKLHVETFLNLADSLDFVRESVTSNPKTLEYFERATSSIIGNIGLEPAAEPGSAVDNDIVHLTTHKSIMYNGPIMQLSTEKITIPIGRQYYHIFQRIVNTFRGMVMGTYMDRDIEMMRSDHDTLVRMWDTVKDASSTALGSKGGGTSVATETKRMMAKMMETPYYFASSCTAFIACGNMLRSLYSDHHGREPDTFEELLQFIREETRWVHKEAPFDCYCARDKLRCTSEFKLLLSLVFEIPTLVHNQTYLLQILAYLIYNSNGREEIFIMNMKNVMSPGLLDKVPIRTAMLLGTTNDVKYRKRLRELKGAFTARLGPAHSVCNSHSRPPFNSNTVDKLVLVTHDPRIGDILERLPCAADARVTLCLSRCSVDKTKCLNRNKTDEQIMTAEGNDGGRNKCCGYITTTPLDILGSSISLAQFFVYMFSNTKYASTSSGKHFYVRDIILSMSDSVMPKTDEQKEHTLVAVYRYLDHTDVFEGIHKSGLLMEALHQLFTMYMESLRHAADQYRTKYNHSEKRSMTRAVNKKAPMNKQ